MTAIIVNTVSVLFNLMSRSAFSLVLLCSFVLCLDTSAAVLNEGRQKQATKRTQTKPTKTRRPPASQESRLSDKSKTSDQRVVYQGIAVDLSVKPVPSEKKEASQLREGDDVTFQLKISDTATGAPLTGAHPAAWMDLQRPGENIDCTTRVKGLIGGGLVARPQLDLNVYYVLALNQDATISVIDPHFGYGGSKLFAMVNLKSPGEDWALTPGGKTLFVSMPDTNQVAVVNSVTWKVITNIEVGVRPARIAVQPDGQNVWVGYGPSESSGGDSGVVVIASEGLRLAARIPTGRGHHEIAFSDDTRFAFVTNSEDGTASVIDVRTLKKIKDIQTGRKPVAVAFSRKAKLAYVANEEDGTIVAVDGSRLKIVARVQGQTGLGQIKFAPDGRFAFIPNPAKDAVHILDAASNRIIQTADIKNAPDQISFSNRLAYVRCQRSEIVIMMPLPQADVQGQSVSVVDFPGGQNPFGKTSRPSPADTIVQAPGEDAVLVGNPADKSIYYYKEGMAAPMGSFSNYGREPRAVLVIDRSFRERSPGVYETTARLTRAGFYDLAFLMDTPRLVHCFPIRVETNPDLAAATNFGDVRIEPLVNARMVWVGERVRLRFKLSDPKTKEPKVGLSDVGSLIFLAPGIWQKRQVAREVEKGIYEIEFEPLQSGFYYVYLECPSLGLKLDNPQPLILQASDKQSQ
jgi:YVTN family beta-propeller protein